jgi:hypothetical protein
VEASGGKGGAAAARSDEASDFVGWHSFKRDLLIDGWPERKEKDAGRGGWGEGKSDSY